MTRVKTGPSQPTQSSTNHNSFLTLTHVRRTNMTNVLQTSHNGTKRSLTLSPNALDAQCLNCAPTSPLECINRCQVYKLKNELRTLREQMNNPNYKKELHNTLKNQTRFSNINRNNRRPILRYTTPAGTQKERAHPQPRNHK